MKLFLSFILLFGLIDCSSDEKDKKERPPVSQKSTVIKISSSSTDSISEIYTNYEEGFKVAKAEKKPVFLLFKTKYCRWCKKLTETTLKDKKIIQELNEKFIVIFLDRDLDIYPSKFKIRAVPVVYLTDSNGEVFTTLLGYHKNPQDFLKWFNYIYIELNH